VHPADLLSESPASAAGPVVVGERLLTLDVLRGIALLGVVVANAWYWFSGLFVRMSEFGSRLRTLTPDGVAYQLVTLLVNGKSIAVFSFLFGMGLAIQAARAERRGTGIEPFYLRRMAVLLAIGVTHGVLIWFGDILMAYALLGLLLLLCRKWSDRALLGSAAVLLVVLPIALAGWSVMQSGAPAGPATDAAKVVAENAATLDALRSLDPARIVPVNVKQYRETYFGEFWQHVYPPIFGVFLLGLWAGRRRVFEEVPAHAAALRRVALWGLGVGMAAGLVFLAFRLRLLGIDPASPWFRPAYTTLRVLSTEPLAAGYVAATVLLLERPAWRARLAAFAPVGRMALTNYLAQSVLCIAVFYGGGLIGRVGLAPAVGIAVAIFILQMAWSAWWLARFHFGPAEWLWRSLTYGRRQPMRIRAPAVRAGLA
jgi:uncharacterized protein